MSETRIAGQPAISCESCALDSGRRTALKTIAALALATGASGRPAMAAADVPQKGDWLVPVDGDNPKPLGSADLKLGEKQLIVYPYDPVNKKARDGSRLNRIIVIKLDAGGMDNATRARAADGVLAYSAFCTHQGCDVSAWLPDEKAMLCFCHFSKFAPFQGAAVVGGPASRPLPALPLKVEGGKLVVADGFTSAPGKDA